LCLIPFQHSAMEQSCYWARQPFHVCKACLGSIQRQE
jgi:hypothetical protein